MLVSVAFNVFQHQLMDSLYLLHFVAFSVSSCCITAPPRYVPAFPEIMALIWIL
uniref:Secreted protein n=1 Tax=Mesocestoides corti TaxID=53468 RepID=A0A5K3FMV3_MESCO